MSEFKKDYIYSNNSKNLKAKVRTMFNNANYADTVFLVNSQKFHASSHLVSVSSPPLDILISTHFEHCGDREMKIRNIKFDESFNVILKCIYGIEINLTQMSASVMYEVLCLSQSYELVEFATDVKQYLSMLEDFTVDSLVALLNIAKKFDLKELYSKLTNFAYKNTEQLVKHDSFKDVQYDVLIDLLPSDWFYAKEIDILSGVLTWHTDMYDEANGKKNNNSKKHEDSGFQQAEGSGNELYEDEDDDGRDNIDTDKTKASQVLSLPNHVHEIDINLVKTFSENVLKSLLANVRISQISVMDLFSAFELDLFDRYKVILSDKKNFSLNVNMRVNPGPHGGDNSEKLKISLSRESDYFCHKLVDITKTFTVDYPTDWDILFHSREEFVLLNDLKFKLSLKDQVVNNKYYLTVYLVCTSDTNRDWECTVECQIKLISHKQTYKSLVLPIKKATFTPCLSWSNFSDFFWSAERTKGDDEYSAYLSEIFTIEIHFRCIEQRLHV
uniref:BTB/POZ domain-containing protein 9 n=1 Tax=Cacopsylla melanoneura TaxID=428564 RepID=A0A8D8Y5I1_9HEMI